MAFAFTEEQEALRTSARQFLESRSDPAAVRAAMSTDRGWSEDLWAQVGGELGWTSLIVPEAYDGAGLGYVALVALMEELGRALYCGPYFSTIALAANAILVAGDDDAKKAYLPGIAAGETTATLAWADGDAPAVAVRQGGDWLLSGHKRRVVDGHTADLLIVEARTDDRPQLFAIGAQSEGVERRALPTMDMTRKLAEIHLDRVRVPDAAHLGTGGHAVLTRILDRASVALAAEQVGGAEACLDLATEYAKVREQFGQPIGSFQAIKHKCADMLLQVESARSAAYYAGWAVDHAPEEVAEVAPVARAYCSQAYFQCAGESIQIHGGIGFTWEHPAHLYFKRARASAALLGSASATRDRLASRLGL